jgi:hypothetical protein
MFGKVYVIEFENGLVKVGSSKNAKRRIRNLETQSCNKVLKTFVTEDCFNYKKIETKLLREFKSKRLIGEYVDEKFDVVVNALNFMNLDLHSLEKQEELENKINNNIKEIIKSFDEKSKTNANELVEKVHCNYCLIPIEQFSENEIINCKEYSELLDAKYSFKTKDEFLNYAIEEYFNEDQIKEFIEIQIDLGDWY